MINIIKTIFKKKVLIAIICVLAASVSIVAMQNIKKPQSKTVSQSVYQQVYTEIKPVASLTTSETTKEKATEPSKENTAKQSTQAPTKKAASTQETEDPYVYESSTLSIHIEPVVTANLKMWIARVKIKNPESQLKYAFPSGGWNGPKQGTSTIARNNNAVFAVNGTGYVVNTKGIDRDFNAPPFTTIRNGVTYRDLLMWGSPPMGITKTGTLFSPTKYPVTADEMKQLGAYNAMTFGPVLVRDGKKANLDPSKPGNTVRYPRTAVGMIAQGDYLFLVADGYQPGYSGGISYIEMAQIFAERGAVYAYNLDGGGSSTMVFRGKIINHPPPKENGERPIADAILVTN